MPRTPFNCRRCQAHYVPSDDQWIFHSLCNACFVEFDTQKMRGRFSGPHRSMLTDAPPEVLAALHLSSADEIPDQHQPYFESCDDWLASIAPKKYRDAVMTTNGESTETPEALGNGTKGTANGASNEDLHDETGEAASPTKRPPPRHEQPAPLPQIVSAPVEAPKEAPPMPAAPVEAPSGNLRLRMKIWTDSKTGRQYLMPAAFLRDVVKGRPISDVMHAYAMRDDETKIVTLTAREWNALPFYYFRQDGPAPRATARPVDVIR